MRRIAELWKPLTDEEKAPWVRLSVADKLRYDQQMAAYNGPLRVPNKRAKKDPGAPKRAMPAFLYYSQEMRPKIKVSDYQNALDEPPKSISSHYLHLFPYYLYNNERKETPT